MLCGLQFIQPQAHLRLTLEFELQKINQTTYQFIKIFHKFLLGVTRWLCCSVLHSLFVSLQSYCTRNPSTRALYCNITSWFPIALDEIRTRRILREKADCEQSSLLGSGQIFERTNLLSMQPVRSNPFTWNLTIYVTDCISFCCSKICTVPRVCCKRKADHDQSVQVFVRSKICLSNRENEV